MTTAGTGTTRVPVVCPRCNRRFYATRDEINHSLFVDPKESDRLTRDMREGAPVGSVQRARVRGLQVGYGVPRGGRSRRTGLARLKDVGAVDAFPTIARPQQPPR